MYKCWRCEGETPKIRKTYLAKKYPEKYGYQTTSLCDKCSKELEEEIEWENEDTNNNIVCPACGYEMDDYSCYEYYEASVEEIECEECNEHFQVNANHSVTFTTKRIRKEN
jgi:DNA-directed RNA polymerase subunit RPC12/RpoP